MKCIKCGTSYERLFACPKCNYMREQIEKAHKTFNMFANRDEKMRALVTGLMIMGIETEQSCQGGKGHIKSYPWVELRFAEQSECMKKIRNILRAYNITKREVNWSVEKQIGGVFWLVPENKNLPLNTLQEGAEEMGWFLYMTR